MAVKEYNKLVRDNIPNIIAKEEKNVRFTCLNQEDNKLNSMFIDKLIEECSELGHAVNDSGEHKHIVEELADITEVFDILVNRLGVTYDEISSAKTNKATEKGSFKNLTYLFSVEEKE